MFFGAGNITLPLLLAQTWPNDTLMAFFGFCITAVVVTFVGLVSGVMARDTKEFFAPLGLTLGFIVQAILISIEGPFGIVPRCLIVAHGSISAIHHIDSLTFYIFSAFLLFFLTTNKTRLVEVIGRYMTPIMLLLLFIIVSVVVYQNKDASVNINYNFNKESFVDGIYKGYLTYDLPGAIYFTTIAMTYLKSLGQGNKMMIINGLKASVISSILLILVYAAFFYIGYHYSDSLRDVPATHILPSIVKISCGKILAIVFASVVFIACISTAIAAISIWTDFIYNLLKKYNIKYNVILALSIGTAVIVSSLEFTGLMKLLTPALSILYPFLLLLAFYNIIKHYRKYESS